MGQRVRLPGARDVRATLDRPAGADAPAERGLPAIVVACPPHPQHGGSRTNPQLLAVSDALGERGIACLRFDYGAWDEGTGERTDALMALAWASERSSRVGLFGYSFGGAIALLAAAAAQSGRIGDQEQSFAADLVGTSLLAPAGRLPVTAPADESTPGDPTPEKEGLPAPATALEALDCPVQLLLGERDEMVDSAPHRAAAASLPQAAVETLPGDHFFVGQSDRIGRLVGSFFADHLGETLS